MTNHAFSQVDVFASRSLGGNPLAVVHDADDLPELALSRFANWTNLSETTFLLAPTTPEADYRVRILTPDRELPFAGHPTLGSAHAWLEAGGTPRTPGVVVQECTAGLVTLRHDAESGALAFAGPPFVRTGDVAAADLAAITTVLGISREDVLASQWVDNGPGWVGLLLRDAALVSDLTPDLSALGDFTIGVIGAIPRAAAPIDGGVPVAMGSGASDGTGNLPVPDFEVRAFFPQGSGGMEDPVTGSLNAGLAQWLIGAGLAPESYIASQGTALGRAGIVTVERIGEDVWVGGTTRTVVRGTVDL
ncbi:PhzF family phenazine biosynthesis protein [Brevibacterium samyangense]|uniref:PhzF family phenazine biosynthesis protein n=1 Tax=Brevibacterium samyangense TaxID=366888 RepID=A0ABP5ER65_9MICO